MVMAGPGMIEMLMLLLMGGGAFTGGGLLGMPPAERDPKLINCAPADTVIYMEWAARSEGKRGAAGVDGLAADPEIREFLGSVERAIVGAAQQETDEGPQEEQVLANALPPIIKTLLMRPGCVYLQFDEQAGRAAAKARRVDPMSALLSSARATLVVSGGEDADLLARHLEQLVGLLPAETRKKGLQNQHIPLPDGPLGAGPLVLHRHGEYFILGFGKGTIEQALAGLAGKSKGLAASERFAGAVKKVHLERTGSITWIDVSAALQKASAVFGLQVEAMAKMVGADAIDSLVSCTGVVDGQMYSRTFIRTGGSTEGILALAAGRAIKPADLALVPADCDLLYAFSLDLPKVFRTVKQIVGAADPRSRAMLDEMIRKIETELGASIENDVLPAFGDVWVLHNSKSAGGVLVTSLVASVEVRDSQKAQDVFTRVMKVLRKELPGEQRRSRFRRHGLFLAQNRFLDHTIYYINAVGEGDDMPFAPAFCVTDRQLLVAPHPQALKAHLRFLDEGGESFQTRLGRDIKLPEGELIAASWIETRALMRYLYALAPYLGQVVFSEIQSQGAEIDIFALPSARGVLPYVGDSFGTVSRTPEGILIEGQSGLPLPTGGLAAVVPMFWLTYARVDMARPRAVDRPAAVPPARAVEVFPPRVKEKKMKKIERGPKPPSVPRIKKLETRPLPRPTKKPEEPSKEGAA